MINYNRQSLSLIDRWNVFNALSNSHLTQGYLVEKFEQALADYLGVKHVIVVANGTAALHLVSLAMEYKSTDVCVTTPNTFVATANGIKYGGAKLKLSDINLTDFNLDVTKIPKCKVVYPVHFGGFSVDVAKIKQPIIEDACHALGSKYRGELVGNCKYSLATVFSFHAIKNITTGEGGAITTNNDVLADKCRKLRSHGMHNGKMETLGYNYRLTDFQCALGISQLKRLDSFVNIRREIANEYQQGLNIDGVTYVKEAEWQHSSYHLFTLQIDWDELDTTREYFRQSLLDHGIQTQLHYIPIYMHPYYDTHKSLKCMDEYWYKTVSIPCHVNLKKSDIKHVINTIRKTLDIN